MLRLLDPILTHLPRLFFHSACLDFLAPPEDKAGMSMSGVISRDRSQLYKDVSLRARPPPSILFTGRPTFDDAVSILPPLPGLRNRLRLWIRRPRAVFRRRLGSFIYAAENAWRHQGKKKSAVFVTLSWNDAWARTQRWTTDYSGDCHAT
ncbi:hypothetical protein B0H14DRAFT_3537469 [Mycena olivaceomarginata]|nr:hypothetical protein B0H14DRAFT_3537469 [Mycena olivaceomarginata]